MLRTSCLLSVSVAALVLGASGCDSASDCIAAYGGDDLDGAAIDRLASEGLEECFAEPGSTSLASESEEPIAVGTDARNGLTLEVFYFCSDVCPDAGWVGVRYRGVEESACCDAGGLPGYDAAWGGYIGCAPPEEDYADANICSEPRSG